eukprot:TRINITY_DN20049_c0_g1_i2.p1 TRINITY_DN20049_c0_g1~~TRINITY_DN20049_c0_g1_i2.p1  ORF type:complete len:229 (-),score=57.57 TRINITY_DN20049_c0_g1_i2:283-969(-)
MAMTAYTALDCLIPAHEKDFETLGHTVRSLRRCCPEVRRILVVSKQPWADPVAEECCVEWLDEASQCWPFRFSDFEDSGCSPGWLLQQLLKLYAATVVEGLSSNVLVCDADVVWLQPDLRFLEEGTDSASQALLCTFSSESCPPIRSAVDLHRYDKFISTLLPGLEKKRPGKETAVCHHAVLQRDILEDLFKQVENFSPGSSFWEAFRDAAQACGGRASEYDLYYVRS